MIHRFLPFLALLAFALVPFALGTAEEKAPVEAASPEKKEEAKDEKPAQPTQRISSQCLASEEVIRDLETREKKLKQKEEALAEKEKDVAAQLAAVQEELNKLEARQAEIQTSKQKQLASNEEKVNKLIETLESMSPKAAAGVIGGVDEELAVTALTRLSSVKAGKILSNLKNDQSSRLSEMMAYGKLSPGKEKNSGESAQRVPASK